jgi:steroid delta-isomerase-like uncharacterized protein
MSLEGNKAVVLAVMEKGFNQGDLSVLEQYIGTDAVDHQEPLGTDFIEHLKEVIVGMRTVFPDLHFEIHHMIAEGEIVAFRSTMTGTHSGVSKHNAMRGLPPPTGRRVSVPHMHFLRVVNGKAFDLWHLWNMPAMMQQLGAVPQAR